MEQETFDAKTVSALAYIILSDVGGTGILMDDAKHHALHVASNGDQNQRAAVGQAMETLEEKVGDVDIHRNSGEVIPDETILAIVKAYQVILRTRAAVGPVTQGL